MNSDSRSLSLSEPMLGYFRRPDRRRFIVSPMYDNIWFIFSPIIAILLGFCFSRPFLQGNYTILDRSGTLGYFFFMFLPQGHLTVTVARSHMNHNVFRQYPFRFLFLPALLIAAIVVSPWIWAAAFVLMIFWDV